MAARVPLVPTEKIIDMLSRSIQHVQSSRLQSTAKCHICDEPFLSGSYPERPITLRCGHIFGEGCILKWVSPLSDNGGKDSCPMCRGPIFEVRTLELLRTYTTYSEDLMASAWLFEFFFMWGLADLVYRVLYWLHEVSIYVPKTVAILGFFGWFLFLVYTLNSDQLGDELVGRHAATVPASRRLMTAVAIRDRKGFCASIAAFEDCLCEKAPEILPKIWRASRWIVRIIVFYRMSVLALWVLLWICGLVVVVSVVCFVGCLCWTFCGKSHVD